MSISLSSRDTGIYAKCSCGTRMFVPTESIRQTPILFCPCGDISRIDKPVINQLMSRGLRSHVAKKSGRLYRLTAERETPHEQSLAQRFDADFVELT